MNWQSEIYDSFRDVLEQQAFMFTSLAESCEFESRELVRASIGIGGANACQLQVIAGEGFARELAENVLGLDEEEDRESVLDAFAELLNVIAGRVAIEVNGADQISPLTMPTVELVASAPPVAHQVEIPLNVDDHAVLVRVEPK